MGIQTIAPELGYIPTGTPNSTTVNINTANLRHAMSFIAKETKVIQAMHEFSITGTLAASEFKCELQSDNAGSPDNTPLETVNCDQTPSGIQRYTHTFSTNTLVVGRQYWMVYKNTNASPGTNFPVARYGAASGASFHGVTDAAIPWSKKASSDASTWASGAANNVTGLRVKFTSGMYDGFPFVVIATGAVGDGIYSGRKVGSIFTTPNDIILRVIGIALMLGAKTGTPTGTLHFELLQGTSVLSGGTTADITTTSPTTSVYRAYFAAAIALLPGTSHRMVAAESTQSDASTNRYNARVYTLFNDADSKALMPFAGTMQKTYFDGSSWTQTDTDIIPCALILDPADPFDYIGHRGRMPSGLG